MTQQQIEAALTALQSKSFGAGKTFSLAMSFGLELLKAKAEKKKWQRLAQSRGETLQQIMALAGHEIERKEPAQPVQ